MVHHESRLQFPSVHIRVVACRNLLLCENLSCEKDLLRKIMYVDEKCPQIDSSDLLLVRNFIHSAVEKLGGGPTLVFFFCGFDTRNLLVCLVQPRSQTRFRFQQDCQSHQQF